MESHSKPQTEAGGYEKKYPTQKILSIHRPIRTAARHKGPITAIPGDGSFAAVITTIYIERRMDFLCPEKEQKP